MRRFVNKAQPGDRVPALPQSNNRFSNHIHMRAGVNPTRNRQPHQLQLRCVILPGCRIPASRTELDHTRAHEHGGRTEPWNLGALCTYHHRAKHEAGWHLRQIEPGVFAWFSPLGRTYLIPPGER